MRCEMEGCVYPAVCSVNAQWSIFDFLNYAMCELHEREATWTIGRKLIDGQRPQEVWTRWWHV
jgi:hypothetical protein